MSITLVLYSPVWTCSVCLSVCLSTVEENLRTTASDVVARKDGVSQRYRLLLLKESMVSHCFVSFLSTARLGSLPFCFMASTPIKMCLTSKHTYDGLLLLFPLLYVCVAKGSSCRANVNEAVVCE